MVKTTKKSVKKKVDEKSINTDNFKKIDWKILLKILPVVFIIIAMCFAFSFRAGPGNLNGLEKNIEASTNSQIQQMIAQEISQKYPNLNDVYKQEKIQKEYEKVLKTGEFVYGNDKIKLEDLYKQKFESVKADFQAENGQTYLNAIDPYFFLRTADQDMFVEKDDLQVGIAYNTEKLAGEEKVSSGGFHSYLFGTLFSLNGIDKNSTTGEKTATIFWIPVIFAMLSVIPAFFIIRKFSDDLSALFGSLLLVSVSTFVSRTVAGFVDTDAYNVFFPLLIVALICFSCFSEKKSLKIGSGVLAGLCQVWYLWAWGNGWFIFLFAIVALLGYLIFEHISKDYIKGKKLIMKISQDTKNNAISAGCFIFSAFIFDLLFLGRNIFTTIYRGIFSSMDSIATVSGTNIWPNVFSSVAELNSASFGQIVSSVGGKFIFFIALSGILALVLDFKIDKSSKILNAFKITNVKKFKEILLISGFVWNLFVVLDLFTSASINSPLVFLILIMAPVLFAFLFRLACGHSEKQVFLGILLLVWMIGTIYMSLSGIRFILLLAPAFAVSFGIGMFYVMKFVNKFSVNVLEIKSEIGKKIGGVIVGIVLFAVLFNPMMITAKTISENSFPNFDDSWYQSMDVLRNQTNEDAIVTSWWDFGHFYTAIGKRSVTFDGGSQTLPQSHWVGKLFMENDEKVSTDILRMLVCSGNGAFDTMFKITNDSSKGVLVNKVIYSTFGKTKSEKIDILKNNKYFKFTDEQVDEIMSKLFCDSPRENVVIASGDMVGKAGVWAHWGSWDFTKKYVHDNYKKLSVLEISKIVDENESLIQKYVDELNNIDKEASDKNIDRDDLLNSWFANYPSYAGEFPCELVDGKILSCGQVVGANSYIFNFADEEKLKNSCFNQNGQIFCEVKFDFDVLNGSLDNSIFRDDVVRNIVLPSQNETVTVSSVTENGQIDLTLYPTQLGYKMIISQAPLGNSLFTKLFYLNGFGLDNFKVISDKTDISGNRILLYKTKFD